jgi:hypothetical protein
MARIKQTDVVLKVSLTLPAGANLKDGQDFVREAVKYAANVTDNPKMKGIKADTVRVALVSSTVIYDH